MFLQRRALTITIVWDDAVQFGRSVRTFRKNLLAPYNMLLRNDIDHNTDAALKNSNLTRLSEINRFMVPASK